jgi:hypothetical protein
MRRTAFLTLAAGVFGCASAAAAADLDVIEATFRYQFAHNASGEQSHVGAYCIGFQDDPKDPVGGSDPPAELISRLADVVPVVKPLSGCRMTPRGANGVKDRNSGEEALIFTLGRPVCATESSCQIDGGYYEANLSSSGDTYYLEKRGGKWVVVKDVMHWIS